MRARSTASPVATLLLALALGSLPLADARPHTLVGPASVPADASGEFFYEVTLMIGPGEFEFASYEYYGLENFESGLIGDCFCDETCTLAEGESLTLDVWGQLDDPTRPGRVRLNIHPCTGGGVFSLETDVYPAPVSVGSAVDGPRVTLRGAPNPFSSATTFLLDTDIAGHAEVVVFDSQGRRVARPFEGPVNVGTSSIVWDVADLDVLSGVYFARVSLDGKALITTRLVVAR